MYRTTLLVAAMLQAAMSAGADTAARDLSPLDQSGASQRWLAPPANVRPLANQLRNRSVQFAFDGNTAAGIEHRKVDKRLRVRGWRIRDSVYFGHARVADKWGVGLVVDRGDTKYGINQRGLAVIRRF